MASSSSGGRSGTHTMVCTCLRAQFYRELSALRLELHDGLDAVRQEMATLRADMETRMAAMRTDILKWSFLFWIGQVATIAALLSFMLRASGR